MRVKKKKKKSYVFANFLFLNNLNANLSLCILKNIHNYFNLELLKQGVKNG